MKARHHHGRLLNVGFVSTRFKGMDGVTLEARKWAEVLAEFHHRCYWFAGELEGDPETSMLVPEAFFQHPDNLALDKALFGHQTRSREITNRICAQTEYLKDRLYEFIERFELDLIVAENVLAIPMHIPLGIALTEVIAETGIPAIGHHHDFYWERPRFLLNAVPEFLKMAFPPDLPSLKHVVINTMAQKDLAAKTGISSQLIYNVADFRRAGGIDDFNRSFRADMGFEEDDVLILQPTRVVSRKGIEQALYLVERLEIPKVKLLISHSLSDEGPDYYEWIKEAAERQRVPVYFIYNRLSHGRGYTGEGRKLYTLWDVYPHVDLITYPSLYEGFGNAFLEAILFKKPLLVNRYSVYIVDIEPKGFDVVAIDGYLSGAAVRRVEEVLRDPERRLRMVEKNFELGQKYFSYRGLRRGLGHLLTSFFGTIPGGNLANGAHTNGTLGGASGC
ncbi:MAG: glycosyltransferase family 4 protein [Spirochaetales bacterium]|nr:glycosyltransferase family 4 protein [Spirochaetales bacterium]